MRETAPLLEMRGISKSFPGVKALDKVNLEVRAGEVLALLGENGAGKSTLLKILSGAYQKDEGEIFLDGQKVEILTPNDAYDAGIRIIYQELNYIPDLSVAENLFLGKLYYTPLGMVDWKKMYTEAERVLALVGLKVDVRRPIGELSVMEKQLIEVAKAISQDMRVLVMDEPTSSLNEKEVLSLVKTVREIAQKGIGVIFISHRLDELFLVADRVTVLRDGRYIDTKPMAETTKDQLIQMMVGREVKDLFQKEKSQAGDVVFEAKDVTTAAVKHISLQARAGEILGVYGLMGAGREEMAETFFGLHPVQSGQMYMNGKPVQIRNPRDAIRAGIAYVPAERKSDSLVLVQTVRET